VLVPLLLVIGVIGAWVVLKRKEAEKQQQQHARDGMLGGGDVLEMIDNPLRRPQADAGNYVDDGGGPAARAAPAAGVYVDDGGGPAAPAGHAGYDAPVGQYAPGADAAAANNTLYATYFSPAAAADAHYASPLTEAPPPTAAAAGGGSGDGGGTAHIYQNAALYANAAYGNVTGSSTHA
jgi:hypothetical protein